MPLPEPPPTPLGTQPERAEESAETTHSKRPLFVAIAVVASIVAMVAVIGVWIAAPGRCDGSSFTSSRFSYCLTTPAGWQSEEVNQQGQVHDAFLRQDGSAAVLVSSGPVPEGTNFDQLVEGIRTGAEDQGLVLEESRPLTVDGEPATQFDAELENEQGNPVAFRIVLVSHRGTYWIVRLQDTPEQFAGNASDLRGMLRSWRFI